VLAIRSRGILKGCQRFSGTIGYIYAPELVEMLNQAGIDFDVQYLKEAIAAGIPPGCV
jgi:hypothetical protein